MQIHHKRTDILCNIGHYIVPDIKLQLADSENPFSGDGAVGRGGGGKKNIIYIYIYIYIYQNIVVRATDSPPPFNRSMY